MANRNWVADFKYEGGAWLVKKTGHRIPANFELANNIFTWMTFYVLAQGWRTWRRVTGNNRPTIAFYPDKPRPWYFIWPVMHTSGARLIRDVSKADIVFQFDDSTTTDNVPPTIKPGARFVNCACDDVSKSRVEAAFLAAAGYNLGVEPEVHIGPMVEKSELNAAHDGRIIEGPTPREHGKTYQRVVDNEIESSMVEDLRCCIVGGSPAIVFRKRRPLERRFKNENTRVVLDTPTNCYTSDEITVIERFAAEIGLDWGGVDVLRDKATGRIFIVDANKTDIGPPIALGLGDKLKSTRRMARAFIAAFAPEKR
ncbi:MAG: hypothetical protein SH820_04230 [Xanthomonadales bacterium]|nr:hypothetical protein [Xanthomonadales bacterium]